MSGIFFKDTLAKKKGVDDANMVKILVSACSGQSAPVYYSTSVLFLNLFTKKKKIL